VFRRQFAEFPSIAFPEILLEFAAYSADAGEKKSRISRILHFWILGLNLRNFRRNQNFGRGAIQMVRGWAAGEQKSFYEKEGHIAVHTATVIISSITVMWQSTAFHE
jgi:hypothetical protein